MANILILDFNFIKHMVTFILLEWQKKAESQAMTIFKLYIWYQMKYFSLLY